MAIAPTPLSDNFSLPTGEMPLGIRHPLGIATALGQTWLQPKFLTPLGGRSLTVLDPAAFSLPSTAVDEWQSPFQDSPFFDQPTATELGTPKATPSTPIQRQIERESHEPFSSFADQVTTEATALTPIQRQIEEHEPDASRSSVGEQVNAIETELQISDAPLPNSIINRAIAPKLTPPPSSNQANQSPIPTSNSDSLSNQDSSNIGDRMSSPAISSDSDIAATANLSTTTNDTAFTNTLESTTPEVSSENILDTTTDKISLEPSLERELGTNSDNVTAAASAIQFNDVTAATPAIQAAFQPSPNFENITAATPTIQTASPEPSPRSANAATSPVQPLAAAAETFDHPLTQHAATTATPVNSESTTQAPISSESVGLPELENSPIAERSPFNQPQSVNPVKASNSSPTVQPKSNSQPLSESAIAATDPETVTPPTHLQRLPDETATYENRDSHFKAQLENIPSGGIDITGEAVESPNSSMLDNFDVDAAPVPVANEAPSYPDAEIEPTASVPTEITAIAASPVSLQRFSDGVTTPANLSEPPNSPVLEAVTPTSSNRLANPPALADTSTQNLSESIHSSAQQKSDTTEIVSSENLDSPENFVMGEVDSHSSLNGENTQEIEAEQQQEIAPVTPINIESSIQTRLNTAPVTHTSEFPNFAETTNPESQAGEPLPSPGESAFMAAETQQAGEVNSAIRDRSSLPLIQAKTLGDVAEVTTDSRSQVQPQLDSPAFGSHPSIDVHHIDVPDAVEVQNANLTESTSESITSTSVQPDGENKFNDARFDSPEIIPSIPTTQDTEIGTDSFESTTSTSVKPDFKSSSDTIASDITSDIEPSHPSTIAQPQIQRWTETTDATPTQEQGITSETAQSTEGDETVLASPDAIAPAATASPPSNPPHPSEPATIQQKTADAPAAATASPPSNPPHPSEPATIQRKSADAPSRPKEYSSDPEAQSIASEPESFATAPMVDLPATTPGAVVDAAIAPIPQPPDHQPSQIAQAEAEPSQAAATPSVTDIPQLPTVLQRLSVLEPMAQLQPLSKPSPASAAIAPPEQRSPATTGDMVTETSTLPLIQPQRAEATSSQPRSTSDTRPNRDSSDRSTFNSAPTESTTFNDWRSVAAMFDQMTEASHAEPEDAAVLPPEWGYPDLNIQPEPAPPATTIQRFTPDAAPVTVESDTSEQETQPQAAPGQFEQLAQEIYRLLRQRLAVERERTGKPYSGRLM
ncbi:MAG: hypothetical protein NW220_02560 [Leptolyngbyaceae cyanobacterium bins.349]|nr:hypothetical protein [Leptolyngbyaceae cyanobacterium bins.349]